MAAEKNYEQIGRFIYGASRVNRALALMMEQMGKPIVPAAGGAGIDLAANALEANAMFARLRASDEAKAQFSSLMQSVVMLGGQLGLLDSLSADDFAACASAIAAAQDALPRFRAIADDFS